MQHIYIVFCIFGQPESESDNEDEEDKISPEEVERPLPATKDGLNFEALIRNKMELEHFQNFLETRHRQGILKNTFWFP